MTKRSLCLHASNVCQCNKYVGSDIFLGEFAHETLVDWYYDALGRELLRLLAYEVCGGNFEQCRVYPKYNSNHSAAVTGGKDVMYRSNRRIFVHKLTMVLCKDFDSILDLQISTLDGTTPGSLNYRHFRFCIFYFFLHWKLSIVIMKM